MPPTDADLHTQLPTDKELVLKVIPLPSDTNGNGDIFGGWVMSQVDLAGSVLCARVAQGRIATVAVNEFIFKQPVRVGDLLSFYSSVLRTGREGIDIACGEGVLRIRVLQRDGGKAITAADYVNARRDLAR